MTTIIEELAWRGQIHSQTDGLADLVTREKIVVYNGFDPTADSLHIGNLIPMMGLARMQRFGHTPITLAGGGTGMIGDPSGRSTERNLQSLEQIAANVAAIEKQLVSVLDFEVKSNPAIVVNNATWLTKLSMIEFLRDVGKHFTINYMLAKDSVKGRMDREDSGLSYTEFSYMLMQGYDYLHLHDTYGCQLQLGGSDQWGNIVTGTTLIRKTRGKAVHALVYPLLLRSDGTKFGKTAEGESVWLDPKRTSPYRFYQFFFNSTDDRVIPLLKTYTFLTQAEIAEYADKVETQPHLREGQKRLAREVTRMIHGDTAVAKAEQAASVLFGGSLDGLSADEITDIFANVPSSTIAQHALANGGVSFVDLLAESGLASSKGDARRSIKGGAMNLNNQRITDVERIISTNDTIEGQFLVLRKGRKKFHLIQITK